MIGAAIGAGMQAIGSIVGGMAQAKAMKKVEKSLKNQQKENEDWYNRRYNEDATQKADAQAMLTKTQESIKARNKQAAAAQAVMGGTDESLASAREANNRALADATSQIAVAGAQQKSQIEGQYMAKKEALTQQQNDMIMQKAANTAQAVQGVANAASSVASMF